ncbi:MAG: CYTH and CHAD domain-containing protein [Acetobacterales bacterium]
MVDTQTARDPALTEDATPSNLEVELKLAGSPETLANLDDAEPLRRRAIGQGMIQRMHYAYYDTADLGLRARGLSFRVRQEGRRYIQTLKSGDDVSGPVHRRGEWQVEVAGFEPHPEAFEEPEARAWLGSVRQEDLRRVFSAEVRRKKHVLKDLGADGVIEVCFDEGEVETAQGTVPIAEIELELRRGSPDALYRLAMELHALSPLRVETQSKSARGYLLATGKPPAARKAEKLALPKRSRVEAAMAQTVRACIDHWTTNEAAALDGRNPEGIHQMRVGLRRLRSALSLFRDVIPEIQYAALQDEARWVVKGLGPARDWDVFLTETLPPVLGHRPDDADLRALRDAAEAKVADGYEKARGTIRAPRYTAFLLTLGAWVEGRGWRVVTAPGEAPMTGSAEKLDRPLIELADLLLTRRHRKVMRLGRGFAKLSAEERHKVRIAVKKLRYATEFFRALYPRRKTRGYLDALERLQDALGVMNDIAVADGLLQLIGDAAPGRAGGLVLGWYDHKVAKAEPELLRDWRGFAKATPFWHDTAK